MTQPRLHVITPDATSEEIAAIVAAIAALSRSVATVVDQPSDHRNWVHGARLAARGSSHQRGSWRLSGRLAGRSRP